VKNKTHVNSRLLILVALSIIVALITNVFLNFSYAVGEKAGESIIDGTSIMPNDDDKNNNKIQDSFEEKLKTMNTTDSVNAIVTLAPRDEDFIKFAEEYGAKVKEFYTIVDAVSLTISVENITKIVSYPAVEIVLDENEKILRTSIDTSIPAMQGDKTTLRNAGFDVDGSGVTIAVVDTGINGKLSSLATLPDGKPKIKGFANFAGGGSSEAFDDNGHGTLCSSIAAAVGRGEYFPGVAPGAQLVGAKTADSSGGTDRGAILSALQWILTNKDEINVVSMSEGVNQQHITSYDINELETAAEKIVAAGIVFVTAAGNEGPSSGTVSAPGTAKNVISVGCVNNLGEIWPQSSRGPTTDGRTKPDISAVGYSIRYYGSGAIWHGTSCACPHVAGTAALLLDFHNKQLDKYNSSAAKSAMKLKPATVKDILLSSVSRPSGGGSYPNNNYGNGMLNIKNALATLKSKNYPPVAKFTTSANPATGVPITFDASGSSDPNGDTLTYAWDFGDGTTGSGKTITHTYTTAKDYTVTLVVKDSKNNANDFGASASLVSQLTTTKKVLSIGISNKLPVASVTVNGVNVNKGDVLTFSRGEAINLDASKSSDPDGQIASVSWGMGDGGASKTGKTVTHSYTTDGKYDVIVKVTDDLGGETQFGFAISISNKLPVAKVTANGTNINKGDELKFSIHESIAIDTSGSSDPDGQVASVSWTLGDGTQKSGKTITHSYSTEGSYNVAVKLTDDTGGETTFTFTINIGNSPPVADIRIGDKTISNGDTVKDIALNKETKFDASHSYDYEGSIKSVTWNMGDGTQKSGLTVAHIYTNMNTYNIAVTLTDDAGAVRNFGFKVEVSNSPPVIDTNTPLTIDFSVAPKKTAFQFASPPSSDTNGRIVSAIWDFGDGVTSDEQNPSHKYDRSGTYTVTYTVTDDAGAIASVSTNVTVTKQPPIAKASGNVKANIRDDVIFDASRSSSPDGEIVSYLWSIEGNDYTEAAIPYRFSERGDYTVTLTVTDEEGLTNTTTVSVNVANMLPAAVMGKIPETINTGDAVEFKATNSFDFDGEIDKYTWNFGDGKTGTGKTTSHVYEKPGTYNAVLTIWDNDGETNTTSFMVNVQGVAGVTAESYAHIGGIGIVCAVVAVIVFLFYFKPSIFGAREKRAELITFQRPQQTTPPHSLSPPTMQQSQYNVPHQPQPYQTRPPQPQYQPQSTRPPSPVQYPHLTQPTSRVQSDQYGEYSTCPACGETIQIPPSADASPVKVVCPSCGAESIIE